jgi:putative salt-induced outer membrane protein
MTAMKFIALAAVLLAAPAAAEDKKPWKNSVELSFVSANGNSKTQTASARDAFVWEVGEVKAELEGGGLGSRAEGVTTAERFDAREKLQKKITDRDYVYEQYRWNRDRFAGVAHRHDFTVGVGRELWKTPKDLLIGEAAPGYLNEERIGDARKSYFSGRLYLKYAREISATAKFSQDVEWVPSLADKRDGRLNTETALTAALTTALSVKNSFVWRHDYRPPQGKRKDDTVLSVALIASF